MVNEGHQRKKLPVCQYGMETCQYIHRRRVAERCDYQIKSSIGEQGMWTDQSTRNVSFERLVIMTIWLQA